MTDMLSGAANMAVTGVGLGILTMGAMVPLIIMKNSLQSGSNNIKCKGIKVNVPKLNLDMKIPRSVIIKKIKIR